MSDVRIKTEAGTADADGGGGVAPEVARWRSIVAFLLSLAGFGIAMYLTVEHFQGGRLVCPAKGFIDCQKVTTSAESYLFHIPVALLGLVFFTGMVVINLPPLWRTSLRWIPWMRLAMAVSGVGFVIYLLYAELFVIKAICLWCTAVHVDTFLLFVLIVTSFPALSGRQAAWVDGDSDEEHEDEQDEAARRA